MLSLSGATLIVYGQPHVIDNLRKSPLLQPHKEVCDHVCMVDSIRMHFTAILTYFARFPASGVK